MHLQRMYKEVQRALRSLFIRSRVAGGQAPEWQMQQTPLGTRSPCREADLPAAVADGGFGGGDTLGSGGGEAGRLSSTGSSLGALQPPAQVMPDRPCLHRPQCCLSPSARQPVRAVVAWGQSAAQARCHAQDACVSSIPSMAPRRCGWASTCSTAVTPACRAPSSGGAPRRLRCRRAQSCRR